jgi:hypothetical protein
MRAHLKSLAASFLLLSSTACVQSYRPPTANEPHAVVKVRRVYETHSGPTLAESVMINEYRAFAKSGVPGKAAENDALLVRPEPATWVVSANFFHMEYRAVQEDYYVQEPYSDSESYSCGGYGTNATPRTCYRTVTKYRSVRKTRTVHKNVEVSDGSCSRELSQLPRQGVSYLLQFTYQDRGVCRLTCVDQGAPGEVTNGNKPCEVPPPSKN